MSEDTPRKFVFGSNGGSYIRWMVSGAIVVVCAIVPFVLNATYESRKDFEDYKQKQETSLEGYKAKQEALRVEMAQQTRDELRKISEILARIDERKKVIKEMQDEEREKRK